MISVMALSNPSSTTAHATLPLCLPARATLFPYTTLFRSADAVVSGIGLERALFEAPRRAQQAWLISHYGPNVNLGDRKSTRLNSSHVAISYAVFCLKKKSNAAVVSDSRRESIASPAHVDW